MLRVEIVQQRAHLPEKDAMNAAGHEHFLLQQLQLDEKELLELQTADGDIERSLVTRCVGVPERVHARVPAELYDDVRIQRFGQDKVRALQ